ncbi:putative oxygen-independent coproporphyrinogen-III oxidase [Corynebacterium deserti GIMN1.010]|uniref:Heme chaperone HemW n=1 Tax=Corynebacterium deserti GIMN1.010 TaxID=931089 RepID=A0A0M3QA03_9CORY|nr:radical SAM family heme chaperone HemW [Corynebacterium deserti]ALC06453.1 putative oxygen-independent coproporphyrinogen-III oxidase [Corynebacterium deserti GIMN1.010]
MSVFGVYIHVPFCSTRCGYCDFNTYTAGELGTTAGPDSYLDALEIELEMAVASLDDPRAAETIFIGGGTPSLIGADGLTRVLTAIRNTFGIAPGAEVTTESNPESTSPEFFHGLREAGYNRISLGMQSASSSVLRVLDRTHTPGRPVAAAKEARQAGFEHVNLDMIYGTPTETDDDVRATLDAVLEANVDHVSAYSLIVEDGTAMARKVRKGELPQPDEDVYADRYELIDARLRSAGFDWYEVSNWAKPGGECQHNLGYWIDGDWWGAGPGAHSHIGDRRFYNVKHPARYSAQIAAGELPIKETELLTPTDHHTERVMLGLRLKQGVPLGLFAPAAQPVIDRHTAAGLLHVTGAGNLAVTEKGRLLADGLIADILLSEED